MDLYTLNFQQVIFVFKLSLCYKVINVYVSMMIDGKKCFGNASSSKSFDVIEQESRKYNILKYDLTFNGWKDEAIQNTFGGKALVDVNGNASFAELAIVYYLKKNGWNARWIQPFGRPSMNPFMLTEWNDVPCKDQTHVPIIDLEIYDTLMGIAKLNGNSFSGCWDVVAWKNENIIFLEAKRNRRDRIRPNQIDWLKASLAYGLNCNNFIIIQWDIK